MKWDYVSPLQWSLAFAALLLPTAGSKMVDSYDFIIVGGGTAGLVVASRLSEDEGTSVLVLEAGPDLTMDPRVSVPLFSNKLYGSEVDWQFRTKPQVSHGQRICTSSPFADMSGSRASKTECLASIRARVSEGLVQSMLKFLFPRRRVRLMPGKRWVTLAGTGRLSWATSPRPTVFLM